LPAVRLALAGDSMLGRGVGAAIARGETDARCNAAQAPNAALGRSDRARTRVVGLQSGWEVITSVGAMRPLRRSRRAAAVGARQKGEQQAQQRRPVPSREERAVRISM
jgi:hypothetical protein